MQIAAHDVGRLSRLSAGCAGVAVTAIGALTLFTAARSGPPVVDPAAALVPAGVALLLQVAPATGRGVRVLAVALALTAAAFGAAALRHHPAAASAALLAGLGLACLDVRVARRAPDTVRFRVADPLVAGAAVIALVALVPRMFDPTFPAGQEPGRTVSRPAGSKPRQESVLLHSFVLIHSSNVAVKAPVMFGSRKSVPTGGTTKPPISKSAAAIAPAIDDPSAPLRMLSLTAINWRARLTRPLPNGGWLRIASS